MRSLFVFALLAVAASAEINLMYLNVPFNGIIGMDYYAPTDQVVVSLNYPSGNPMVFALIAQSDGSQTAFTNVAGFTEEVKIATARDDGTGGGMTMGGFMVGDLFVGNGADGQIVRITNQGGTVQNPWVSLGAVGLMRGSMVVDESGVWGGDLLVCTTAGYVFRVSSNGAYTQLAYAPSHMEGINVGPNDPSKFGALAGSILIGREGVPDLFVVHPDLTTSTYTLPTRHGYNVAIEDIDICRPNTNWFGAAFAQSRIAAVRAEDFANFHGEILVVVEFPVGGANNPDRGMYWLRWDFTANAPMVVGLNDDPGFATGSVTPTQWEHVTFAHAGIDDVGSGSDCDTSYTADEGCSPASATAAADTCVTLCLDANGNPCSATVQTIAIGSTDSGWETLSIV